MRKLVLTFLAIVLTVGLGYSQVTTQWEKSATAVTKPYWDAGSVTRGIGYGLVDSNHRLYVVNRHADFSGKQIFIFNALTGDSVGRLDTTGLAGGTFPVNDVEVSTDGVIFVGNLTTNSSTSAFKVYKYTGEVAVPVVAVDYTSVTGYRLGDKFTVTGSTADNSVIIWAANATATGEVVKFTTTDNGVTFSPEVISVGTLASFSSAAVGPLSNGDFYFNAHGMNPRKHTSTGTLIGAIPNAAMGTSGSAIRHLHTFLGDEYVVANDVLTSANNAKILKVPGGVPTSATLFAATSVLGSTSAGGLGDVAVQKVSNYIYNVFVLATNNGFGAYQVDLRTPLAGDYFIPQGANPQGFATLNDAVTSLNINGASAPVSFVLDADTLRENSFTFNSTLSAVNNLVIKPAPGRDVVLIVSASASVGNGPFMIGFNSGYVTFDGSNNGTDTRNLLVTTEQMSPTVDVPFTINNADADNVVLKNLMIKNIVNGQTNFRYGAVINDLGGVVGFQVVNCQIGTVLRPVRRDGLAPWGGGATANQFSFVNNEINCGTRGVATIFLVDSEIIGNTINMMPTTAVNTNNYNHGLYITGATGNTLIAENTINCLEKANVAGTYTMGIAFAGNTFTPTDVITVVNNMINVGAVDETGSTYGIGLRSAGNMGNLKVYYNTILINNNASTLTSHAVGNHTNGTGPVDIDLKNNILINNHAGNASSSAIGLIPALSVLVSDYNLLLSNQNLVNYLGTTYANLAAWQAAMQDANSVSKAVTFASATDLHLAGTSNGDADLVATPIAGITFDIDGDTRSVLFPYKGADEAPTPIPVELTSFAATVVNGTVHLVWKTATETNNQGFEIQRKSDNDFEKIGYVPGTGTTTQPQSYSFVDDKVGNGKISYRLRQVDYDGSFSYSNVIELDVTTPLNFELTQNYPNPFNPSTTIEYTVAEAASVNLTVFNMLGEQVTTLVNELVQPGKYSVRFDASSLASGTYIYRITAGSFVQTKKMILTK